MNSLIETLNLWGGRIPDFAWPMLWQSSVLIAVLFVLDLAARRKVRATVRYALWLVVLVKLLLPPSLALPTSLAWWVRAPSPPLKAPARTPAFVVTYGNFVPANFPTPAPSVFVPPPKPSLSGVGWTIAMWAVVGAGLLAWLLVRWRQVARDVRLATVAPEPLNEVLHEVRRAMRLSRRVRLRLTKRAMSPAVCGLFRPVILLPQSLAERLTPSQLRAVLFHELVHLRRGDVWVNCAQALLQILYWWHPLLWLANARIRRVREEAVDDAVMLALRDDAETYAPTLLEVAKLAFNRPLASLGLVGIMESRSALRQRIERLVEYRPPRKAGLTIASAFCVLAFAALAVPMEQAPPTSEKPSSTKDKSESSGTTSAIPVSPNSAGSKTNVTELVQRGRLLLEAGKWDEAENELNKAIAVAPQNKAAFYYLNLVKEARYSDAERRREQDSSRGRVEIDQAWPASVKSEAARVPNPYATTNLIFTGKGRQAIVSKLDRIRIKTVLYQNLRLSEVAKNLREEAKSRDPENIGINFLVDPNPVPLQAKQQVDPATGLPVTATESGVDIAAIPISIDPPITNVRLADVLEAIVRVAGNRIKYSIEEYAVVFSHRGPELEPLSTRTFKLEPNIFYKALEKVSGVDFAEIQNSRGGGVTSSDGVTTNQGGGLRFITRTNFMVGVSVAVQKFFASLGVNLDPALGKSIFWSDRSGWLLVRATKQDLDTIEVGIEALMAAPDHDIEAERQAALASTSTSFTPTPPKNGQPTATATNAVLETRLYRLIAPVFLKNLQRPISESPAVPIQQIITNYLASAGVSLQPPSLLVFNERNGTLLVRVPLPQHELIEHLVQQLNSTPAQINIKVRFVEIDQTAFGFGWYLGDILLTNGTPANFTGQARSQFQGVLTDPQFRVVLRALEQRNGVDLLTGPEVTTVSGRQAQVQVVEMRTVVTGINPQALVSPGIVSTNGLTNSLYQTQTMPFGRVLDVIPSLSADGYTINMTVIPSVSEFLGYDDPTTYGLTNAFGQRNQTVLPLPHFRVRQMTVTANVRDGQTLVLGNPTATETFTKPDGSTESKDVSSTQKKQLIVFITPTLVDAAGIRLHSDDGSAPGPK